MQHTDRQTVREKTNHNKLFAKICCRLPIEKIWPQAMFIHN